MTKLTYFILLTAFYASINGAPAFSQHALEDQEASMEEQPVRDISGSFKGGWTDLYKKKGEIELKIYAQYADSYAGYLKLKDKNGKIYTGTVNISLAGDYFTGYYTPSAYADEDANALGCQLMIHGKLFKEKNKYLLKGEAVSAACYENNILEIEIKEEELLAEGTKSGK